LISVHCGEHRGQRLPAVPIDLPELTSDGPERVPLRSVGPPDCAFVVFIRVNCLQDPKGCAGPGAAPIVMGCPR
jgi:hypothetical protein